MKTYRVITDISGYQVQFVDAEKHTFIDSFVLFHDKDGKVIACFSANHLVSFVVVEPEE